MVVSDCAPASPCPDAMRPKENSDHAPALQAGLQRAAGAPGAVACRRAGGPGLCGPHRAACAGHGMPAAARCGGVRLRSLLRKRV